MLPKNESYKILYILSVDSNYHYIKLYVNNNITLMLRLFRASRSHRRGGTWRSGEISRRGHQMLATTQRKPLCSRWFTSSTLHKCSMPPVLQAPPAVSTPTSLKSSCGMITFLFDIKDAVWCIYIYCMIPISLSFNAWNT